MSLATRTQFIEAFRQLFCGQRFYSESQTVSDQNLVFMIQLEFCFFRVQFRCTSSAGSPD